ncbi:MAG: hypothetical protein E7290_10605 [Lachnospiraceae bacterium]|nr:hypothetical protein [Lachnospiraceae bacterium]
MRKNRETRKAEFKAAVIKRLKSLIAPCIILAIIVAGAIFIALWQEEEEPIQIVKVKGYEGEESVRVLENDRIRFELDSTTTQFTVTDKRTGDVWYSNPQNAEDDELALKAEKQKLLSTLILTYSTQNGVDTLHDNYRYCVQNQIYEIEEGEDYIKVYYSIGDVEKEYMIPPVITVKRMESFLANMSQTNAMMVQDYYKKYDINKLGKKDNKEELLAMYPILETEPIYVLRDTTKDNVKTKFEIYFGEAGYTDADYRADKELDMSVKTSDKPVFNVNVIYRLDGDDLLVEIPMGEIEYQEKYPIYYLSVLPYFGAAGIDEEGYMFVPEGGGALINFNNGKIAQNSYYSNLYGWDMAINRKALVHETRTYFNAFGIAKNNGSMLCILEEGAPYASVQADISGRNHNYNYVNAVYNITHREQYDVADKFNGEMFVYEDTLPNESLVQRYCFVDSTDYSDMALCYREYLLNKYGDAFVMQDDTSVPVAVEVVGAVDKMKQVVGVPVSRPLELTTYEEAQGIIEDLQTNGVQNMSVKLTGWMNGGVQQKMLNDVNLLSELGGKKDFKTLIDYTKAQGIDLYLNGITNYAIDSDFGDGFVVFRDAARLVSKEKAELYPYSEITYSQRDSQDPYYLLKGSLIEKMASNLVDEASKYQVNVSFDDMGEVLSSDFTEDEKVTRQDALNRQVKSLQNAKAAGQKVMIPMGNNYALPYSDFVTEMDLAGSEYTILDKQVPFYQMAIHGYVNYAGESLNLTQNFEDELLKSAEYGAALSFTFMKETLFTLQNTLYYEYFGADYDAWKDKMLETYAEYEEKLGHVFNQCMTDHDYVTDKVTCTTYEDGTRVYVNYGYEAVSADGVEIPAKEYVVIR